MAVIGITKDQLVKNIKAKEKADKDILKADTK